MMVKEFDSAQNFLKDYEAVLLEHEAVSQLILYNAYPNLLVPASEKCIFGAVLEEEATLLLFCNVAQYNLVVYAVNQNNLENASAALADFITSNHISITGINAKQEICESFIEQYNKNIGSTFVEKLGMDIMEIRELNDIKPVDGKYRLALPEKAKLITNWMIQYQIEALANEVDYEAALEKATLLIDENKIYVYENIEEKVVSMAITARALPHGIAFSYVFTPEEYRGKGYAAANIYFICKEMLESGYEFCTIFADKKNPVFSRAYEKVGFKILEDQYDYKILPPVVKD